MANTYTDTRVIECSRLHSEEALSGNNSNLASWTNNLTDVIHLEPGDVVSMHGAMISERGAGGDTIEIKGVNLGIKKTFDVINISGVDEDEALPSGYKTLIANVSTVEKDIRDDEGNFIINYYISANGHNYIQLPRRFWWYENASPISRNWTDNDTVTSHGRTFWEPFNGQGQISDFEFFYDYYQQTFNQHCAQKNDGSRYTIMIRDKTFFTSTASDFETPDVYLRDPENAIYRTYTELKTINVDRGFNSPEYIATEITRQLQKVTQDKTFNRRVFNDISSNPRSPGFPIPVFKTYETQTFKAFDVAGLSQTNVSGGFDDWLNSKPVGNTGAVYIGNYHVIACKRPELYETGRLINSLKNVSDENEYKGIKGSELLQNWGPGTETEFIVLNQKYDKETCDYWRDFFNAQDKYPEIWTAFTDSRNSYETEEITTSRWVHMNRRKSSEMTDGTITTAQLGWSGYYSPVARGNSSTSPQFSSLLFPIQYDQNQKDTFYSNPNPELGQKTYGCIGRSNLGNIILYPTANNGYGSALFNYLDVNQGSNGYIENETKIGFDMHFSAPGVGYILPYSGFTEKPQQFNEGSNLVVNVSTARNSDQTVMANYNIRPHEFRTKLYIGADAPKLQWDGTHFSLSDLHTGMNRGNDYRANSPYFIGGPKTPTNDVDAGDIVYKINPTEQYYDWTPVRMPYVAEEILYLNASNNLSESFESKDFNSNLEPWQIYDTLCGIFISDFGLDESEWSGTLWERLGFSYSQFHSSNNTRLSRIDYNNANDLSLVTTNSEVNEGDTKIYFQNMFESPMYANMIPTSQILNNASTDGSHPRTIVHYPAIIQKTQSIQIIADNLPTRMIRGYYTIRSNILEENPFVGGLKVNTQMPIIATVNKINPVGDFVSQQGGDLEFTITKPLRLASIRCSVHDPDGSYANTNEQSAVLFKIIKQKNVTFNVLQEILQQSQGRNPKM